MFQEAHLNKNISLKWTIADDRGYCRQILLLEELRLPATSACSVTSGYTATIISRITNKIVLCRNKY
jgi:hypothetical protein